MPPLALHTAVAKEVADSLRLPSLDNERGSLYLGATAPDIRVITRWDRERTHFFDLNLFEEQSGIAGFFSSHPALAQPGMLNAQTVAFVAGYLTHLVMDEAWIKEIYRPHFGERSELGGGLRANVMDRALQFSMDSERRRDRDLMLHVFNAITSFDLELDIGFIEFDTLTRWRELMLEVVNSPPDWERFREGAKRHLRVDPSSDGVLEELALSLPDLVDETVRYLTPEKIEAFMNDSLKGSAGAVKEYLRCG